MNDLKLTIAACLFAAITATTSSAKAEFCRDVENIARSGHFEAYKGAWNSDAESYDATVSISGSRCTVSENLTQLSCHWPQTSRAAAEQGQQRLVQDLSACFGSQSKIDENGISPSRRRTLGGPITHMRAIVGGKLLRLTISAGGIRMNAGDRWTTGLNLGYR